MQIPKMFKGYFIKYNPKEPIEDCGYIAVFWRIRGEKKQQMVQAENGNHEDVFRLRNDILWKLVIFFI